MYPVGVHGYAVFEIYIKYAVNGDLHTIYDAMNARVFHIGVGIDENP